MVISMSTIIQHSKCMAMIVINDSHLKACMSYIENSTVNKKKKKNKLHIRYRITRSTHFVTKFYNILYLQKKKNKTSKYTHHKLMPNEGRGRRFRSFQQTNLQNIASISLKQFRKHAPSLFGRTSTTAQRRTN